MSGIYHLILLLIVGIMAGLGWMLVRSAPRALSLILPANLSFYFGSALFIFAIFGAFTSAFALQRPEGMLDSFITLIVGVWFMFASSAGMRGSASDEALLKRVGVMMALLLAIIVASLYFNDPRVVSILSLGLIGAGYWAAREYLTGAR